KGALTADRFIFPVIQASVGPALRDPNASGGARADAITAIAENRDAKAEFDRKFPSIRYASTEPQPAPVQLRQESVTRGGTSRATSSSTIGGQSTTSFTSTKDDVGNTTTRTTGSGASGATTTTAVDGSDAK